MPISGNLYILTAPSGAGKTTLANALIKVLPTTQLSVSYTTRPQRSGELQGIHYWFVDTAEFKSMVEQNAFLEHAQVHDHDYGTSLQKTEMLLQQGIDVILAIDWQGAQQIREYYPSALSIFILPPSRALLRQRLQSRGQDSADVIERRLAAASGEISHYKEFEYVVINDVLEQALEEIQSILLANKLTTQKQALRHPELLAEWL